MQKSQSQGLMQRGRGPKQGRVLPFSVANTGVRTGDTIRGTGKQNKGTVAQVLFHQDWMHPVFSRTKDDDTAQLMLRDKMNMGVFKDMTFDQKMAYLEEHSVTKDKYFEDIPGCEMRFLHLTEQFLQLSDQDQRRLLSGDWIPMREIYQLFVQLNGGKASLLFRPEIWILDMPQQEQSNVCDQYVHLVTGQQSPTLIPSFSLCRVYPVTINGRTIGFCDDAEPNSGGYKSLINANVVEQCQWFTPAIWKALLQKCIRVGAPNVVSPDGTRVFPVQDVILTSFFQLMDNPGSFVPDLQLFVSGGESAFKRLAIILIEDSYITSNMTPNPESILIQLFGAALCFRHYKSGANAYVPSTALINLVVQLCEMTAQSKICYDYRNTRHLMKDVDVDQMGNNANGGNNIGAVFLLEELRSFESDILMLKDIVHHQFAKLIQLPYETPREMRLSHCLDQHSVTMIAHFLFDPAHPDMSIEDKMKLIWKTTGQNPRRLQSFDPHPLVIAAQQNLWMAKASLPMKQRPKQQQQQQQNKRSHPDHQNQEHQLTKRRRLDPSWIAGIVGPMEQTVNRTHTMTFINPNNIAELLTIRKPTRDKAANELSDDVKLAAETQIEYQLQTKWTPIREPLIGANLFMQRHEGAFLCRQAKEKETETTNAIQMNEPPEIDWLAFCQGEYLIPMIPDQRNNCIVQHPERPYQMSANGIMESSMEWHHSFVQRIPHAILLRIAMYMRPIMSTIHLRPIARDGTGMYKEVDWTDSYVFRYFQQLCIWMPLMISTDASLAFTIHHFPLWQEIKQVVFDKVLQRSFAHWPSHIAFRDTRSLRVHQQEALEQLIDRVERNKRGHLIWMEPGQGKTLIVTSFLGYLISQHMMPTYCVYTLPRSAMSSIESEFQKSGIPYIVYSKKDKQTKQSKQNNQRNQSTDLTFHPHVVTLVEHDTLRQIRSELLAIASDTFVVIDEMHLLMNQTKRTSTGIELANVAADFIAMTGTLIKDNDASSVIQWLEMVSDFPITERNYMIGIASLISRKLDLHIVTNHVLVSVPMNARQLAAYHQVVGESFGGHAPRTDVNKAFQICQEVVLEAIVQRAKDVVRSGRRPIFVVAKDRHAQERMMNELQPEFKCFAIDSGHTINLPPDLPADDPLNRLDIVITTLKHSAGYTLTKCDMMITGVYFSNQATREQLLGRIVRMGQRSKQVDIETYHTGLLSYTQKRYESAKAVADSLRGMVKVGEHIS